MIVCAIIGLVGNVVANRMASYIAMKVTTDLRHDLFCKIQRQISLYVTEKPGWFAPSGVFLSVIHKIV